MRILVCGDRYWTNKGLIKTQLARAALHLWLKNGNSAVRNTVGFDPNKIIVIEGEAPGADTLGKEVSRELGIPDENILKFPVNWTQHGKAAGPIRNTQMLAEGKPDLVLAFHSDIGRPRCGTLDMIKQANKSGIEVRLYSN